MTASIHPEHVIVFAVTYHPFRPNTERFVHSFGALEVTLRNGTDVEFHRHHHLYSSPDRASPYRDMRILIGPRTACICVLASRRRRRYPLRATVRLATRVRAALPIVDLGLRGQTHVIQTDRRYVRAYAHEYGIPLAGPAASPLEQARRAPDQAQALWLTWLFGCLGEDYDQLSIAAAFHAWRKVDELRPVVF